MTSGGSMKNWTTVCDGEFLIHDVPRTTYERMLAGEFEWVKNARIYGEEPAPHAPASEPEPEPAQINEQLLAMLGHVTYALGRTIKLMGELDARDEAEPYRKVFEDATALLEKARRAAEGEKDAK
jgi:hypothetical protein